MIANGFGWFGGVVWGFGTGIVLWSLSGWGVVPTDSSAAVHATALLGQGRRVFWRFVLGFSAAGAALGTLPGMVPGFLRALTYPPPYNRLDSAYLCFPAGVGLAAALLFSPALALVVASSRTAWGEAAVTRLYLARRRNGLRLPRDLMAFLADAHEHRGTLRQIGPVYQFRHIDLQRRLANRLPTVRRCAPCGSERGPGVPRMVCGVRPARCRWAATECCSWWSERAGMCAAGRSPALRFPG